MDACQTCVHTVQANNSWVCHHLLSGKTRGVRELELEDMVVGDLECENECRYRVGELSQGIIRNVTVLDKSWPTWQEMSLGEAGLSGLDCGCMAMTRSSVSTKGFYTSNIRGLTSHQ